MDPNKSGTAPPTDFSGGEKSSMGQSAPPPYYDNPGSGHFNPGYPPQPQVRARLEAGLRICLFWLYFIKMKIQKKKKIL